MRLWQRRRVAQSLDSKKPSVMSDDSSIFDFDTAVFMELKRMEKEVHYWKNKYECDFVVKEGEKIREAIQVCHNLIEENKEREISGITEAMEEFQLKECLIITGDFEGDEDVAGRKVSYKPIRKWLLEQ